MSAVLNRLVPSLSQSIDGLGFLFGAGASFAAGYPLMSQLTKSVVEKLSGPERSVLDSLLASAGLSYDDASALPNIEELADLTIAHAINSGDGAAIALEDRLRTLVVEDLLDVHVGTLEHHLAFFHALQARSFGLPTVVWLFTTNYDVLFETAATLAGIEIRTGFSGATSRFFDPSKFTSVTGQIQNGRFARDPKLVVNLVKLHGSLSWTATDGNLVERHPESIAPHAARTVVLPRRRKVIETLSPPFDQLFHCAARQLGSTCRYLVSCGYSFSDEHINQNLLAPALRSNKIRIAAFCDTQCSGLASLARLPSFNGYFSSHEIVSGKSRPGGGDLWKFENLANAI